MTLCTQLSDRMPAVALGRSHWTPEEQRHLAACTDCRAEWDLVAAGARLGAAAPGAPDASAIAARVLQRLRAERARQRSRGRVWAAAGLAAALAALAVWTGRGASGRLELPGAPPARVAASPAGPGATPDSIRLASPSARASDPDFPLPELDSLPADALDSVLRVLDEPLARAGAWQMPDLEEAGDQELEAAFTGKEG
jgi:hypothetical protein